MRCSCPEYEFSCSGETRVAREHRKSCHFPASGSSSLHLPRCATCLVECAASNIYLHLSVAPTQNELKIYIPDTSHAHYTTNKFKIIFARVDSTTQRVDECAQLWFAHETTNAWWLGSARAFSNLCPRNGVLSQLMRLCPSRIVISLILNGRRFTVRMRYVRMTIDNRWVRMAATLKEKICFF